MSISTTDSTGGAEQVLDGGVQITQHSVLSILAIWAAAALPMGALAWLVTPRLADRFEGAGPVPMARALIITLTIGLIWQFVLVAMLVRREQGTLRWETVRRALWLVPPRSPRTGRIGGRTWLVVIPLIVAFALAHELIPKVGAPADRDFVMLLTSDAGKAFLDGAWGWYALILVMFAFNTFLGEELLFRGFLLPRMNGALGRADWIVNGLLFAAYHLHVPWAMPTILIDTLTIAYPSKRFRSAWIGVIVHSSQSVVVGVMVLALVL